MANSTYASQDTWKTIQQFLPSRLHPKDGQQPVEEWWENRGHQIHLDRWRNPKASLRVIMHHGVGTNGRQMSMILGAPLSKAGYEVVAMDMPGYGCTTVNKTGGPQLYKDWVDIADDFVDFELEADDRPIVLYGLSAGGMLTYHVAAQNKKVRGIIGMTFLDQRSTIVRDGTSIFWLLGRIGMPLFRILDTVGLGFTKQPMARLSKMSALVNDPDALRVFLNDSSSAGSWVSVRFLNSYMNFKPALEPAAFVICPVLLTQPAEDHWTPLHLSQPFLSKIKKVPVKTVLLENAGHYPLEDPGLQQMADAIIDFLSPAAVLAYPFLCNVQLRASFSIRLASRFTSVI